MGLKNKLSKMKSFLFDEEEEKETTAPIKKVKKEKEIFKPKKVEEIEEIEDLYINDVSDEEPEVEEIKPRSTKVEPDFSFPEFDDDDFMVAEKKPEPIIKPKKEEPRPVTLYQGSKRKEEFKKFKPSPIISPIYGLLDEEGNSVKEEKSDSSSYNDEVSFDEVRKKAYGKLDDEIEDTIKRLNAKTIEEAEEEMKREEFSRSKNKVIEDVEVVSPKVIEDDDEDDDMILPNVNFKEIDVDKESKKPKEKKKKEIIKEEKVADEDEDDDTKEQDLFNLIDTMYQENGDED